MRKFVVWLFVGLLMGSLTVQAGESRLGIGAFGGLNIPVVQDDQASGMTFGVSARVRLLPFLAAEPNVTFTKWGQPDPIDGVTMPDGSDFNSYGIDAILGRSATPGGIAPFIVAGVANYKVKNDQTGYDESGMGYSGGLGILVGLGSTLELDVRGKIHVAPQEQGSKKAVTATAGLVYNLAAF